MRLSNIVAAAIGAMLFLSTAAPPALAAANGSNDKKATMENYATDPAVAQVGEDQVNGIYAAIMDKTGDALVKNADASEALMDGIISFIDMKYSGSLDDAVQRRLGVMAERFPEAYGMLELTFTVGVSKSVWQEWQKDVARNVDGDSHQEVVMQDVFDFMSDASSTLTSVNKASGTATYNFNGESFRMIGLTQETMIANKNAAAAYGDTVEARLESAGFEQMMQQLKDQGLNVKLDPWNLPSEFYVERSDANGKKQMIHVTRQCLHCPWVTIVDDDHADASKVIENRRFKLFISATNTTTPHSRVLRIQGSIDYKASGMGGMQDVRGFCWYAPDEAKPWPNYAEPLGKFFPGAEARWANLPVIRAQDTKQKKVFEQSFMQPEVVQIPLQPSGGGCMTGRKPSQANDWIEYKYPGTATIRYTVTWQDYDTFNAPFYYWTNEWVTKARVNAATGQNEIDTVLEPVRRQGQAVFVNGYVNSLGKRDGVKTITYDYTIPVGRPGSNLQ